MLDYFKHTKICCHIKIHRYGMARLHSRYLSFLPASTHSLQVQYAKQHEQHRKKNPSIFVECSCTGNVSVLESSIEGEKTLRKVYMSLSVRWKIIFKQMMHFFSAIMPELAVVNIRSPRTMLYCISLGCSFYNHFTFCCRWPDSSRRMKTRN